MTLARIEHVAFWTDDIDRLAGFYVSYFGAAAGALYTNPAKGFSSRFLSFGGGARLELMKVGERSPAESRMGASGAGLAHFALAVGSERAVDEMTHRLERDGHRILDGPRRTGDGYYESVVLDPDGNRLEITA